MAASDSTSLTHSAVTLNGLPAHKFSSVTGSSCIIYEHGACMASFVDATGTERLYVSPSAVFDGKKAIRGGIPLIFPQFGPDGPLPNHGFARTSSWTFDGADDGRAVFSLEDSEATQKLWDHNFQLRLIVSLEPAGYTTSLQVRNTGTSRFECQALLHTYHAVSDAAAAAVTGLSGAEYVDKLDSQAVKEQHGDVKFDREVDRIYRTSRSGEAAGPVVLAPVAAGGLAVTISSSASTQAAGSSATAAAKSDVVVWNPWVEKSAALDDLPDDGYKSFVCVEPGCVDGMYVVEPATVMTLTQAARFG